jgi:hypothetical protein
MTTPGRSIDLLAELARDPASGLVQIADGWYQAKKNLDLVDRPLAHAAIVALDAWGVDDPEAARAVLSWWRHYDQLTSTDLTEVLEYFTRRASGAGRE